MQSFGENAEEFLGNIVPAERVFKTEVESVGSVDLLFTDGVLRFRAPVSSTRPIDIHVYVFLNREMREKSTQLSCSLLYVRY